MGKRNPPARYTLPEVVDPEATRCFTIHVPDDIYHVAAFKGAIYNLSRAYVWGRDPAHTALAVAAVWKEIFYALTEGGCCTMFRVDGCLLQQSDDGETWTTLVDLSECTTTGPQGEQGIQGIQGEPGEDGTDGEDGADGATGATGSQGIQGIPGTAGLPGTPGEPGNDGRNGLDAANVPPPDETSSDGLRCSVAVNMAREMRALWGKLYDADVKASLDALAAGGGGGAAVVAVIFPGVALLVAAAAVIIGALKTLVDVIDAGEIENFDDAAEERIRCYVYCVVGNDGDFDSSAREEVVSKIRADTNFVTGYNDYIADFINVIPLDVLRWVAWTSSAISTAPCLDCDCTDLTNCPDGATWKSETDFRTGLHGWTLLYGTYAATIGINGDYYDPASRSLLNVAISVTSCTIKRIEWIMERPGGSGGNNSDRAQYTDGGGNHLYGAYHSATGAPVKITEDHDQSGVTGFNIAGNTGEVETDGLYLQILRICGTGTKPPELP